MKPINKVTRRSLLYGGVAGMTVLAGGRVLGEEERPGMEVNMHQTVETVIDAWKAAFDAGDPQRIASLYTPDAMFIGGIGGVHIGRRSIEGYFGKNMAPSSVVFRDIKTHAIEDQVVLVSMMGAITPEVGEPRDFRFLQTHVRTGNGWQIAGHHGSHSL